VSAVAAKPVVMVPACNRVLGHHPFHIAGKKYIDAVRLAGCQPLVVPSASVDELDALLGLADGLFLTGSPSNVHPSHFDEGVHNPALPLDAERDAWTLPLIPKALALGVPLLAICRGAQETNVALGGSLHQAVQDVPGCNDHRADDSAAVEVQYGPSHRVDVVAGGVLARVLDRSRFDVNSLHAQAVNRLAAGLVVEARSPDGVIEAFSKPGAPGFNLCVQWHPEWLAADNPVSMQILSAFGAACRSHRAKKQHSR
jgi:putative glutamine amidotransferase